MSEKSIAKKMLIHLAASEIVLIPATILLAGTLYSVGLSGLEILFWLAFGLMIFAFFRTAAKAGLFARNRKESDR